MQISDVIAGIWVKLMIYINKTGYSGRCANLNINFENISENIANEIEIFNIKILKSDNCIFQMNLKCCDKYDEEHNYLIRGVQKDNAGFPIFKITELD